MRQRFDDPIFNFSNTNIASNSADSALTTVSSVAAYTSLAAVVNLLTTQMILMGMLRRT